MASAQAMVAETDHARLERGKSHNDQAVQSHTKTVFTISRMKREASSLSSTVNAAEKFRSTLALAIDAGAEFHRTFGQLNGVVASSANHLKDQRSDLSNLIELMRQQNVLLHSFSTCLNEQFIKPLKNTSDQWKNTNALLESKIKKYSRENDKKSSVLLKNAFKARDARDKAVGNLANSDTKTVRTTMKLNEVLDTYDKYFETHAEIEERFAQEAVQDEMNNYSTIIKCSTYLAQTSAAFASQSNEFAAWLSSTGEAKTSTTDQDHAVDPSEIESPRDPPPQPHQVHLVDPSEVESPRDPSANAVTVADEQQNPPLPHINITNDVPVDDADNTHRESQPSTTESPNPTPRPRRRKSFPKRGNAVAVYPYEGSMPDELSLVPGRPLDIVEESDDGWVRAIALDSGEDGWFHGSFAQRNDQARFVTMSKAFHPEANTENALNFNKGDRIRILAEASDAWWLGLKESSAQQDKTVLPLIGFVPVGLIVKESTAPKPKLRRSSSDADILAVKSGEDTPTVPVRHKKHRRASLTSDQPLLEIGRLSISAGVTPAGSENEVGNAVDISALADVSFYENAGGLSISARGSSMRGNTWTKKRSAVPKITTIPDSEA